MTIARRIVKAGTAQVVNEHKITIDKKEKRMLSKFMAKNYSFTYNKRVVYDESENMIDSRPYGYIQTC